MKLRHRTLPNVGLNTDTHWILLNATVVWATEQHVTIKKREEGIGVTMTTLNMEDMMELTGGEITKS